MFCRPEIICNKSLLAAFNISPLSYNGTNRCGSCSCKRGVCLPIAVLIYISEMDFESVGIWRLSPKKNTIPKLLHPDPSDQMDISQKECSKRQSMVQLLLGPPVTISNFGVAYLNKHCLCLVQQSNWIFKMENRNQMYQGNWF